ncbi:MAG: phosphoadenosine phosphosulfate reductase family protein [Gemmataceae bacterium]
MTPDLQSYDWIVVNSSAGKDSQAMLDYVVELADAAGVRDRLVVLHCDLGKSPRGHDIEWPGTLDLAREHAEHYGLRFIVARRGHQGFLETVRHLQHWPRSETRYCTSYFKRDQGNKVMTALAKEARDLVSEIRHRGMFPSTDRRYCTSYFKRDCAATAITQLAGESREWGSQVPRILQCFGFRAQESPRRRKLQVLATDKRISNSRKRVDVWLPIHGWTVEQVWERIGAAGTRHHYAYDRGMTRLSCRFCIFAPLGQLMISARENPELFAEYVQLEKDIGHTFRVNLPLAEVDRLVKAGTAAPADDGAWNM